MNSVEAVNNYFAKNYSDASKQSLTESVWTPEERDKLIAVAGEIFANDLLGHSDAAMESVAPSDNTLEEDKSSEKSHPDYSHFIAFSKANLARYPHLAPKILKVTDELGISREELGLPAESLDNNSDDLKEELDLSDVPERAVWHDPVGTEMFDNFYAEIAKDPQKYV